MKPHEMITIPRKYQKNVVCVFIIYANDIDIISMLICGCFCNSNLNILGYLFMYQIQIQPW